MSNKIKFTTIILVASILIISAINIIPPIYRDLKIEKEARLKLEKTEVVRQRIAKENNDIIQYYKDHGKLSTKYRYYDDPDYSRLKLLIEMGLNLETIVAKDTEINKKLGIIKYLRDMGDETNILFEVLLEELEYNSITEVFFLNLIQKLLNRNRVDLIKQIKGGIYLPKDKKWTISNTPQLIALSDMGLDLDNIYISGSDTNLLKELNSRGYNFDNIYYDEHGNNLLSERIFMSDHEYVIELLNTDIDINKIVPLTDHKSITCYRSSYLINALTGGIRGRNPEVVNKILSLNPDVNITQGETYYYYVENENYPNDTNVSALLLAIYTDWNIETIKKIILQGAEIDHMGYMGSGYLSPLMIACDYGNKELVELLLANGADINLTSPDLNKTAKDFTTDVEIINLLDSYK